MGIRRRFKKDELRKARLGFLFIVGLVVLFLIVWSLSLVINVAVISAFVTILLAIFAFAAIWNTSSIYRHSRKEQLAKEKRDRRERLLNEIIEWAVDVLECGPEVSNASLPLQAGARDQSIVVSFIHVDLLLKYRKVDARSEYVRQITLSFEKGLQSAVKKATDELYAVIEFLREHLDIATTQEVRDYRDSLIQSALAVVKEAARIKKKIG